MSKPIIDYKKFLRIWKNKSKEEKVKILKGNYHHLYELKHDDCHNKETLRKKIGEKIQLLCSILR